MCVCVCVSIECVSKHCPCKEHMFDPSHVLEGGLWRVAEKDVISVKSDGLITKAKPPLSVSVSVVACAWEWCNQDNT